MSSNPLFTLSIPNSSGGTITCTSPSLKVYLLTFTSPPDNRLLTPFCQTLLLALDILEFSHPHGVLITTSGIQKFYSNGLDLEHSSSTPRFFPNSLFALFKRLLTYPMPTIALINGHAFAGGFMLSMYHDYRVFNPSRGFLCLNELDLGVPLKPPMSSIFRQKLVPAVYKTMVLEAKRFSAKEALESGIVDVLGGLDETTRFIGERKLSEKAKTGVYGLLKAEMFRETLGYIDGYETEEKRDKEDLEKDEKRKEEGVRKVAEWERSASKAKL
ncbi:putative carnitinyl-CoA dehydratase [Mollisia scopiformis]|uniref:Putative carnitinyl-CoA dehydratase n=1 Tax=Mollisia scopiformis TaxID=149040 RepID=A0A194XS45_MOLSC|nr:putative carnitinyl-CoA dehydratase [Mollisia scopiformis]KUJ22966.1 putative carnitinyl-CoA dehydratase [Mollisia scopiformis]